MLDRILDFFFPPACPFCQEILEDKVPVCKDCLPKLPFVPENSCSICSRPIEEYSHHICADCKSEKMYFSHSFASLIYKDMAKECAIALKASHPYFAKGIAYLIADRILSSPHYTDFDFITFVPQSPKGRRGRGYNQAQLIAKELSKLLKVPCSPFLKRTNELQPIMKQGMRFFSMCSQMWDRYTVFPSFLRV